MLCQGDIQMAAGTNLMRKRAICISLGEGKLTWVLSISCILFQMHGWHRVSLNTEQPTLTDVYSTNSKNTFNTEHV